MPTYDFTAAGFLVIDILCRYAEEMPPPGGATFVDEATMTVAGTAGATALDCAILGLKGQIAARVGRAPMGDFLLSEMRKHGLDTGLVQIDDAAQRRVVFGHRDWRHVDIRRVLPLSLVELRDTVG